jgi:uncharacterized lipoprotein YmbA
MISKNTATFALFLLAFLFSQSCILPEANHVEPDFYLLNLPDYEQNGSVRRASPAPTFYLSEIELPQYLRDNRLVFRPSMESVGFREYKRWGEPLEDGISRVLGNNLAQRLGTLSYSVFPNRRKSGPQFDIAISFLAFEKSSDAMATLDALIELRDIDGDIFRDSFQTSCPLDNEGESAEVRALSKCLGNLSQKLAKLIHSNLSAVDSAK